MKFYTVLCKVLPFLPNQSREKSINSADGLLAHALQKDFNAEALLTHKMTRNIQDSWIEKILNTKPKTNKNSSLQPGCKLFGETFYSNLFTLYPEMESIFGDQRWCLLDQFVSASILGTDYSNANVIETLKLLGARHGLPYVNINNIAPVWEAFERTLIAYRLRKTEIRYWFDLFRYIVHFMYLGASADENDDE